MTNAERYIARTFLKAIDQYMNIDSPIVGDVAEGYVLFEHLHMSAGEHLMAMLSQYGIVRPESDCLVLTKLGADLMNYG